MMKKLIAVLLLPLLVFAAERPNILVVLTDDLGFSDVGCYGSEIETPVLDRLAANGLRFSQFYNTAKCHSSRVSLLSGRWCRQAGDEKLSRAVIIPEILGPAGYFTAMTGKWHLDKQPTDFGFERYFGHLSGACNFYKGDNTFRLNGKPWRVPDKGFYTTVANVDYALDFLTEARKEKKPWFLYVAFNAPHAPLQPLKKDYKKYLGRYDVGWDKIREERLAKQRELKLLGGDVTPSSRPEHVPAWKELTPELRNWEARRMAAYAGMIDRIDQEMGRLVEDIEKAGELDNTIIMFFSDNGACPYDRLSPHQDREPYEPDVTWSDSTGWAWARNSPFRYYKQNQFEGGICTPAIVHWPAGIKAKRGSVIDQPAHLVDVLPTLAELADVKPPHNWPGRKPSPLAGISLVPILRGETLEDRPPIHLLFNLDRGLRDGDWKLVSFQSRPWELYNIAQDRTELNNLASKYPERVDAMAKQWHEMAANELMAPKKEQAPVAGSAEGPHRHKEWSVYAGKNGAVTSIRGIAKKTAGRSRASGIRARRETKLKIKKGELILTCRKGDPGIAIDHIKELGSAGPYSLRFEVKSSAGGEAEVYYTTDAGTILPKGTHLEFDVVHDGKWHEVALELKTEKELCAIRIDPCSEAGTVRIRNLRLQDAAGKILRCWP